MSFSGIGTTFLGAQWALEVILPSGEELHVGFREVKMYQNPWMFQVVQVVSICPEIGSSQGFVGVPFVKWSCLVNNPVYPCYVGRWFMSESQKDKGASGAQGWTVQQWPMKKDWPGSTTQQPWLRLGPCQGEYMWMVDSLLVLNNHKTLDAQYHIPSQIPNGGNTPWQLPISGLCYRSWFVHTCPTTYVYRHACILEELHTSRQADKPHTHIHSHNIITHTLICIHICSYADAAILDLPLYTNGEKFWTIILSEIKWFPSPICIVSTISWNQFDIVWLVDAHMTLYAYLYLNIRVIHVVYIYHPLGSLLRKKRQQTQHPHDSAGNPSIHDAGKSWLLGRCFELGHPN